MPELLEWVEQLIASTGVSRSMVPPLAQTTIVIVVLLLSVVANFVAKKIILQWIKFLIAKTETRWDDVFVEKRVFDHLSHLAPALVIYGFAGIAFPGAAGVQAGVKRVAIAYMIVVAAVVANSFLDAAAEIYTKLEVAKTRPIRTYVQVAKLFLYLITAVLVVATLLNRSPWAFLSGLGALTAVIMLVFKDTILGFVASVQLTSHDMVRPGDWIEMPKYGADGDVIDITLNTVKVRNWDKTVSTIPTYALVSDAFKNWRGMSESGGRRIKRAVYIDVSTIRFCTEEMLDRFEQVRLLREYIREKRQLLKEHNAKHDLDAQQPINARRLTNIGTFRAYLIAYLKEHPKIHSQMTFLVRQLPPGEYGLPIEIYVFSNDQVWANYEAIQADIFDHVLAVIPEFGLRVFQRPSGADVAELANTQVAGRA